MLNRIKVLAAIGICWFASNGLAAQSVLLDSSTWKLLVEELSGETAKEHVVAITRHHRVQGSRGYSAAAQYVLNSLREYGFGEDEAWIESFESDGRKTYQTWQSPPGWWIDSADLRIVEPLREPLVRFPEIPMSLMTYSNPGRVRAELVDVGSGTSDSDYQGKNVRDKFVLATGYGGDVHRLAVLKFGAAAVIAFLDDERAALYPDMLQYTGLWPRTEEIPRVTFGFNLTNRQGRRLKDWLALGRRVVLEAKVDGEGLGPGRMDVVVARLKGSEEKELLLTAHLDHPKQSANDNASGSGALLDAARVLKKLKDSKQLDPRKGLRFLWVPEYFGTMAYLDAHPELKGPSLGGSFLTGLNFDMVGENLELLHSRMNVTWTPPTLGGVIGDVTAEMAARVDAMQIESPQGSRSLFNYRVTPYSGGSDHAVLNDGSVAIPTLMLGHWPDYTHHTSEDTADKVDPAELKRVELIGVSSLVYLSRLGSQSALELAALIAARAQARIVEETRRATSWLLEAPPSRLTDVYQDAKGVLEFALEREQQTVRNVLDFNSEAQVGSFVQTLADALEGQAELQRRALLTVFFQRVGRAPVPKRLSTEELEADSRIPVRLTRGPLAGGIPELRLADVDQEWYSTDEFKSLNTYFLVNLIDGRRSVLEIRNDLAALTSPIALASVARYLRDLSTAGVVRFETRTR